jgi:opacity protein-like surface antigen
MKMIKYLFIITLVIAVSTGTAAAMDKTGNLGISVGGGLVFPIHGGYVSPLLDLKDVVGSGPNFGLGVSYGVTEAFVLEGKFRMLSMAFEDEFSNGLGANPTLTIQSYTLNGIIHLGNAISPGSGMSPFLRFGWGMYPLAVRDDGMTGDVVDSPTNPGRDFSKTALGLNLGAGFEYAIVPQFSVYALGSYEFVNASAPERYDPSFGAQGFFLFDIGISYNLPTYR